MDKFVKTIKARNLNGAEAADLLQKMIDRVKTHGSKFQDLLDILDDETE